MRFEKINDCSSEIYSVFWNLYEQYFPLDERRDSESQQKIFLQPEYFLQAIYTQELTGFISFWKLKDFIFIEHYMVTPDYCGRGWGTKMIKEFISISKGKIILEVERPENELTSRRIKFYERNGFHLNRHNYIQPPYGIDKKPIPLYLMSYPEAISADEFEESKILLFASVYG